MVLQDYVVKQIFYMLASPACHFWHFLFHWSNFGKGLIC